MWLDHNPQLARRPATCSLHVDGSFWKDFLRFGVCRLHTKIGDLVLFRQMTYSGSLIALKLGSYLEGLIIPWWKFTELYGELSRVVCAILISGDEWLVPSCWGSIGLGLTFLPCSRNFILSGPDGGCNKLDCMPGMLMICGQSKKWTDHLIIGLLTAISHTVD